MLGDFQRVIPELSSQLQSVAVNLNEVMAGLSAQQREQQALVAGFASSNQENVQRLGESLAKEGSQAMARVLAETNDRIDRMVAAMDEAGRRSAGRTDEVSTEIEAAATRVASMTATLGTAAQQVTSLVEQVDAALTASRQGVAQITEAAARLKEAADAANGTIVASHQARARMEELLSQQVQLAESSSTTVDRMQSVWPGLLQQLASTVQSTTSSMAGSWEKLSDKLTAATARYGQDVGEKVQDLSNVVATLTETLKQPNR